MNKLEEKFYNEYELYYEEVEPLDNEKMREKEFPIPDLELEYGIVIGPYKVDFVYGDCVIELDGHDYHKTKEQRDRDYKRERYLQRLGYHVIRFTGTEVYLEARKCIIDMVFISNLYQQKLIDAYFKGSGL